MFWCVILLTVIATGANEAVPLLSKGSPDAVSGQYIVVFSDEIADDEVKLHHNAVRNLMKYQNNDSSSIKSTFKIGSFKGYTAIMNEKLVQTVQQMEGIKYIEVDQIVKTKCTVQEGATWGIVRTTSQECPSTSYYNYDANCIGYGVDVYVIDTGIEVSHSDFNGRAQWGVDYVDNADTDLNGHGTHCAGTIMSDTWGLAKKATAIAVRVLDENGSGYISGVINGINWVVNRHYSKGGRSVANLSLGGGYSSSLNDAVDAAVSAGVHMVVAAGNELTDACYRSPASSQYSVTVGASDSADDFAYFSNYGSCVDIIAPGVYITSTWLNNGVAALSGKFILLIWYLL
jgi:subtilisin family serine protease